jgi:transposase
MPRFKPYSYLQTKLIPLSLTHQIQPGTFEYALNLIVDTHIDMTVFNDRFKNDDTGAPAFDPAILLKIVLYAYSRGITSSRKIAQACEENIIFMALSADTHPHFTTIADFITSMQDQITPVFRDVITLCHSEGLIGRTMFAVDGCKLSSNCSKEWSGTRADLKRKAEKIEHSIRFLVERHRTTDSNDTDQHQLDKENQAVANLKKRLSKITDWLENNPTDKQGARKHTLRQSNVVDNESAKMPTSHGVVQGFTGVAAVDSKHQVVVYAEAFGENQEKKLLQPAVEGVRENFIHANICDDAFENAMLVADTGYHSDDNIEMLQNAGVDAIIADTQFRKRDPRFSNADRFRKATDKHKEKYTRKRFHQSDFILDKVHNVLVCPAGKTLQLLHASYRNSTGHIGPMYQAFDDDCMHCMYKKKCLVGKTARRIFLAQEKDPAVKDSPTQKMIKKFDTPHGRFIYSRRMGIVEPVFGHIRNAIGLTRFSFRGKVKVDIQWKLFCLAHNIKKLFRFSQIVALS